MKPHFLELGPALLMEGRMRVLVIADTHFGAEAEMARKGVHIQSSSSARLQRVLGCIDDADPDLLLFLGDVKHGIPLTSRQEYRELPEILRRIRKRVELKVTPGNHDGGIEKFLSQEELLPSNGAIIDGVGYLHGHTYPAPELIGRLMVVGHHHPVLHIYDEVGCALRAEPAYVLCELDVGCMGIESRDAPSCTRALFMPACFELSGGLDVRQIDTSTLGPISRCVIPEKTEVFLKDGTYIDSLAALKAQEHHRPAR
jgi:metallophosphoesterase superfamily enzyme